MLDRNSTMDRHWTVLRLLPKHPRKLAVRELQARLSYHGIEVSTRTLQRDLHSLSSRFPLALDDREKPYGWSWSADAATTLLPSLTTAQATALLLTRSHLGPLLPRVMEDELAGLFQAAEQTLVCSGWRDWDRRTAVVSDYIRLLPPPVDQQVLESIQRAIAGAREMLVSYRRKGARASRQMIVHPLGLFVRKEVIYLACTIGSYQDVRHLAVHRIDRAEQSSRPRLEPGDFDLHHHLANDGAHLLPTGAIDAVLRFHAPAGEHLLESRLALDQKSRYLPDGRLEIRAKVTNDEALRWWLLAFGSQVEVVSPAVLRTWVRNELTASIAVYDRQQ